MIDQSSREVPPAGYSLVPGRRSLRARVAPSDAPVELRRLSVHDGELVVDADQPPLLRGGAPFALHLETDVGAPLTLRARCREVRASADLTTVRFEHAMARRDASQLHALLESLRHAKQASSGWARPDPRLEEIAAPRARVVSLLRAMVRLHSRVRVETEDGVPVGAAQLTDEASWPAAAFKVLIRAPHGDVTFEVDCATGPGQRAVRLLRGPTHAEPWAPAPSRTRVEVEHPLFADERVSLSVISLSRAALRVRVRSGVLFHPGLELPDAVVRWKGGAVPLRLVVGETFEDPFDGRCSELHVRPEDWGNGAWCAQVDRLCHPHTRLDADQADALWDLYAESGYLNISDKRPELFEPLRDRFRKAAEAIAAHPDLGAQVTWRSMDGLDGSVTFLTAWERSCLLYQLARGAERPLWLSGNRALYDLYRHATDHVVREGARWIVVFVQHEGARFSKKVNRDFPRRHDDGERSHVSAFRAWEIPTAPRSVLGADEGCVRVVPPSDEALHGWLAGLPQRRPTAYREAYDLVPGRLRLAEPEARFGGAGLGRGRVFRLATVAGRPVAMAWIEHVEDGVHLFGLLDAIRIDVFEGLDEATEREVRRALVTEAQRHLGGLGKKQLIFFDEALGEAPVPGAIDLGDADQALFSTELRGELLEEVAVAAEGKG